VSAARGTAVRLLAALVVAAAGVGGCAEPGSRRQRQPADALPGSVTSRPVDGTYPAGLPDDPDYFPVGVWLPTVVDPDQVALDRSLGLNLYVGLAHEDAADLDAVEAGGMHLLVQVDEWEGDPRADHPAVDGWLVDDEADLTYGPGWDPWSGTPGWNTCVPVQDEGGQCGYTVMQQLAGRVPEGALRYANYGVGLLRFETDAEAAVFVNQGFQDVVSADDYGFTRPDAGPADRTGASYGRTVARLRDLDGLDGWRQPVWAVVETGHPFTEASAPTITAPQVRSAVWHSLIAGARGIVYFDHSFGGSCPTSSALRERCDPDLAPTVRALDAQIAELAPVLNAPFADGYVTADGPVAVTAKQGPDGGWYVLAAADAAEVDGAEVTFRVAAGSTVEVVGEGRDLAVRDGRFVDTFADGDAVHVYRVT